MAGKLLQIYGMLLLKVLIKNNAKIFFGPKA